MVLNTRKDRLRGPKENGWEIADLPGPGGKWRLGKEILLGLVLIG